MTNKLHYFKDCQTIEEAKASYKELAMKFHPDRCKDPNATRIMQEINNEFERFIKEYKQSDRSGKTAKENATDYINIIEALLELEGVEIELIGSWLWLHGETYQNKERIKGLGFKWSKGKKSWYWNGRDDSERKPHRSEDWITTRMRYGSEIITGKTKSRLQLAQV